MSKTKDVNSLLESSEYYSRRYKTPTVKLIFPVFAFLCIMLSLSLFIKIDNVIAVTGSVVQIESKNEQKVVVESFVTANESINIKKGQKVQLYISGTDKIPNSLSGEVTYLSKKPILRNDKVMYQVRSCIDDKANSLMILKYGMEGDLSILIGKISLYDAVKQGVAL